MHKYLYTVLLLPLLLSACATTCESSLVESVSNARWKADLKFRKCGSTSGYMLALYKHGELAPGYGLGSLEPFQAIYQRHRHYPAVPGPVSIRWESEDQLLVEHTTKKHAKDGSSLLRVIKADTYYREVSIRYIPGPFIFDEGK